MAPTTHFVVCINNNGKSDLVYMFKWFLLFFSFFLILVAAIIQKKKRKSVLHTHMTSCNYYSHTKLSSNSKHLSKDVLPFKQKMFFFRSGISKTSNPNLIVNKIIESYIIRKWRFSGNISTSFLRGF